MILLMTLELSADLGKSQRSRQGGRRTAPSSCVMGIAFPSRPTDPASKYTVDSGCLRVYESV